jgi:hypothetical protein
VLCSAKRQLPENSNAYTASPTVLRNLEVLKTR